MKPSFLSILIISVLLLSGGSESPKPGPVPRERPQQKAEQTKLVDNESKSQQSAADPEPMETDQLSSTLKRGTKPDQNADKGGIKILDTNLLIAIFTGLLVVVGALQAYFLRGALKATEKAATAAANNADTLIRQNSPYLRFSSFSLESNKPERPEYPHVAYTIRNYGGGRAFLTEMSNNIQLTGESLPQLPQYHDITPYSFAGISLGHMDHLPIPVTFPNEIRTIQDVSQALQHGRRLFVYGYVKCSDVLRQIHTFGFGYEYVNGRFVLAGGNAYNYRRCEQETETPIN